MGFGLHQGWAIEGAIGSFFKIDASYLSPNVNMAARLEAATGQFETPLLISGDLRDLCSIGVSQIMREIDTVTVKGSIRPVRIYTITINTENMKTDVEEMLNASIKKKKKKRDDARKKLFAKLHGKEINAWQHFSNDNDFLELRKSVNPTFERTFAKSYRAYIEGDWNKAGKLLKDLIIEYPNDGPTRNLHRWIVTKHNC